MAPQGGGQSRVRVEDENPWVLVFFCPHQLVRQHCSKQHVETVLQHTAWITQGCRNVQYFAQPGAILKRVSADFCVEIISNASTENEINDITSVYKYIAVSVWESMERNRMD